MNLGKVTSAWHNERLGLTMIVASLGVIAITVFLLFQYQLEQENVSSRVMGHNLTRLISRTPYQQMLPNSDQRSLLSFLAPSLKTSSLAYIVITDIDGTPVDELSTRGIVTPSDPLPQIAPGRLGERTLTLSTGGKTVTEFYAVLSDTGNPDGVTQGWVQLAFLTPTVGLSMERLPFLATLALPIFLLTPVFYFLIRREFQPLKTVDKYIATFDDDGPMPELINRAGGELGMFIGRINHFMDQTQHRIRELERDRSSLETNSKLLTYKRSRIESVLESIPDGILVMDESGSTTLANNRFCQMLGLTVNGVEGKKPAQWSDDVEVITFLTIHEGKAQSGPSGSSVEFRPKYAPDKTLSMSSFPLFASVDAARIFGTLVVLRDASVEVMTKQATSEFVAHLAHELKSPLTVLAMYSESLQSEDGRDEAFRIEAANVMHDEVERLALLINNMLNITRIEIGNTGIDRERVRLRDLLQDAFDSCARLAKDKKLEFKLDLPKEIAPIALDKSLVRIAINNLLTNAIKYTAQGGEVTLSVEETDRVIQIFVRDNGIGIPEEDQVSIFEKFHRSDSPEVLEIAGHGLGLSLAKEIVLLHHGTLTVKSELGEGSEFAIEFVKDSSLLRKER